MPQASPKAPTAAQDAITRPDADLVAQLRAGDESAMAQLVDEWSPTMLRVARSFVGSAQSAEDVVQDAWLGMLSGLARFEGRSSLRTWTFSILVNRARTRGTHEARTLPQPPLGPREALTADDCCRPGLGTVSDLVLDRCPVPLGHLPRDGGAVQGSLAAARPRIVGAAATAAHGGDHA